MCARPTTRVFTAAGASPCLVVNGVNTGARAHSILELKCLIFHLVVSKCYSGKVYLAGGGGKAGFGAASGLVVAAPTDAFALKQMGALDSNDQLVDNVCFHPTVPLTLCSSIAFFFFFRSHASFSSPHIIPPHYGSCRQPSAPK
jgi:hypothetical protein